MDDPHGEFDQPKVFDLDAGLSDAAPEHGTTIDLDQLDSLGIAQQPRSAPALQGKSAKAVHNLIVRGEKARKAKRWVEAAKCLNEAWGYDRDNINLVKALADVLAKMGARTKAIDLYFYALERAPQDSEIASLAGSLAIDMEMWEQAERLNAIFIELQPLEPIGYVNRATALRKLDRFDEAVTLLQHALPLMPESADLWNVLGSVVNMRDDLDTAMPFYQEALRLDPTDYKTPNNLARALNDLGRYEEAIPHAKSALKNTNDRDAVVEFTLAMAQLGAGDLPAAWESYACRLDKRRQDAIRYGLEVPYIGKESVAGKNVIVVPEQGVGDEVLFLSALNDLIGEAGDVAVACDARLVDIVKRSFPALKEVVSYADTVHEGYRLRAMPDLPDFGKGYDAYMPMGDLLCRYRPSVDAFKSSDQGFFKANEADVASFKDWLDTLGPGLKVGVCWRSGLRKAERNFWYADQAFWEPILKTPGVTFVNLQYGDCEEEIAEFEERCGVKIHQHPDIDLKDELDKAAALTAALDHVVSIGAQPAMTAFALDKPIFWLLPFPPWWNFGARTHAPMHQKSRFFMGDAPMDWSTATARAAEALAQLTAR